MAKGMGSGYTPYSRKTAGGKYGDWFLVAPPLTINKAECGGLVSRLRATFKDFSLELNEKR
jgi:adenosylmethionine-8-amino-7-oxononanoate aminotransferase